MTSIAFLEMEDKPMLPNEPFCFTDLQYLTVPLPAEIAALRENADFAGEVRRIDKLLPRVTDTSSSPPD